MAHPPQHILVVEDRTDWRDILSAALSDQGYMVHTAADYSGAMEALQQQSFNLAIIDPVLDMTNRFNRDGLSVIQQILKRQSELPIIIMTGSLTHDMEITLQHLYPQAPILFKERWDRSQFKQLVGTMIGQSQEPETTAEAGDPLLSPESTLQPPSPENAAGRPRVLLVENRADWQEIVVSVLEKTGCFWRMAGSGQEALAQLNQRSFHLVILDLKLHQTDLPLRSNEGWLLLDYLVENHPKTQIIILSGRAGPSDVADLLTQYPVIGFIEKQNFRPEVITRALDQVIQAPTLRIQTLGAFQIWCDNQPIGLWEPPLAETLLKLLLVRRARGEQVVPVDELITRFWPGLTQAAGRKKLLPLISAARHILEPDTEPHDSNFILRSANGYYFDLGDSVTWDLLTFREHLQTGVQHLQENRWPEAVQVLKKGQAVYRGDFLAEDRYADWAIDIRREITADYCQLLVHLADAYAAQAQYDQAVETCQAALAKDPLLEHVYQRLMQFHYCNGHKTQALKAYRDCLKLFEELFGESPTPLTRQIHQKINAGEPLLPCPPQPGQFSLKD